MPVDHCIIKQESSMSNILLKHCCVKICTLLHSSSTFKTQYTTLFTKYIISLDSIGHGIIKTKKSTNKPYLIGQHKHSYTEISSAKAYDRASSKVRISIISTIYTR